MKKAFSLLITIFVVAIFSILILQILTSKNIISNNLTQEYLYTQANFNLNFYKSLILNAQNIECNNKNIEFKNEIFKIYANTKCIKDEDISGIIVDLFVKSKDDSPINISLHTIFTKVIK